MIATSSELRLIGEWMNAAHPFSNDSDGDRVVAAADEMDRMRRWKAEALPRLAALHEMHDILPVDYRAKLGESMDAAVLEFIRDAAAHYPQATDSTS